MQDATREDSDQAVLLVDDRNPLSILDLEEPESILERDVRSDGVVRRLGDVTERRHARIQPSRDNFPNERLARDHPD